MVCRLRGIADLCRRGMEAFDEGRGAQADFYLYQALREARGLPSPVLEAKIMNNIGLLAALSGRREEAARMLSEALRRLETRVRTGSLHAVILKNLNKVSGCAPEG